MIMKTEKDKGDNKNFIKLAQDYVSDKSFTEGSDSWQITNIDSPVPFLLPALVLALAKLLLIWHVYLLALKRQINCM